MKTISAFLTLIGLLTFCLAGSLSADRLLYEHTVNRENESVEVTKGHPWWQGDGDIVVSAEKRIFDVSESQAKSTVSSSVSISCNVDDGSFVGIAQIKGTADTGASAFLASSYQGIASSGIPDTLSTSDLNTYQGKSGNASKTAYVVRLPGLNSSLLYTGIKRHGIFLQKGTSLGPIPVVPTKKRDLTFDGSASTVKQKAVGATDSDILAMFSPYASANGFAQNNAGQGIGNQVPSSSADTNMEGKTKKNISDAEEDEDDEDEEDKDEEDKDEKGVSNDKDDEDSSATLLSCGHEKGSPGSHVKVYWRACGHTDWHCLGPTGHNYNRCPKDTDGQTCTGNAKYPGFYLPCDTSHAHQYPTSADKIKRGACGHVYDHGSSAAYSHRQIDCRKQNGVSCQYSFYYACRVEHAHAYTSDPDPPVTPDPKPQVVKCANNYRGAGKCSYGRVVSGSDAYEHQTTCGAGHKYWSCNATAVSAHSGHTSTPNTKSSEKPKFAEPPVTINIFCRGRSCAYPVFLP